MMVWFIQKFDATRFGELFEGFEKVRTPTLTLLNENSGYAVGHLELFSLSFTSVNLFQNDAICGKVTFLGGPFKNVTIQFMVKVEVEKVFFCHCSLS